MSTPSANVDPDQDCEKARCLREKARYLYACVCECVHVCGVCVFVCVCVGG